VSLNRLLASRKILPSALRERSYVEAYAVAQVAAFRGAEHRGFDLCVWLDNRERVVCVANFTWESSKGLHLHYKYVGEDGAVALGAVLMESAGADSQGSAKRALILCPCCGLARAALVLRKGQWHCRTCHALIYRSTKIGSPVRYAERYAKLAKELERLIEKRRRSDLIARKRREMEAAMKRAGPLPHAIVNSNYAYTLTPGWGNTPFLEVPLSCEVGGRPIKVV
jgi:hypothetical protein